MVAVKQSEVKKRTSARRANSAATNKSCISNAWVKHDGLFANDPYFKAAMAEVAKKRKSLKA